jgi:threonine dehydrogenase-like Zn-dependent dehydrogenase
VEHLSEDGAFGGGVDAPRQCDQDLVPDGADLVDVGVAAPHGVRNLLESRQHCGVPAISARIWHLWRVNQLDRARPKGLEHARTRAVPRLICKANQRLVVLRHRRYVTTVKAVSCQDAKLDVVDLPAPEPGKGQVLIDVVRCGICGSDLHARHHADLAADVLVEAGYDGFMRSDQQIVFGHEFSGVIADYGRGCRKRSATGTPVVALPLRRSGGEVHAIGLSAAAPGAYAEQLLVEESLMFPVPNGLSPELAALTEPMAIGWHAVRRSEIKKRDVAIVIGCGPVGLAVICMLKAKGVRTVVASDLSTGRRALAIACGADVAVDPREDSPYEARGDSGHLETLPAAIELALGTMEKLRRLPVPWHHVWRAAEKLGAKPKHPVIFECVGVPGIIDGILTSAPLFSRAVVVGVCMEPDRIRPAMAINKEIDLRFVVGYTPLEFRDTLRMLAEGEVDVRPIVTGTVGLGGVEQAFDALADPETHAKILIDPRRAEAELLQ